MARITSTAERRTNVDEVFEKLHHDIITLRLMPGTKMSEVEIANQFSVSRQPVRDAFARLGNLGLLLIRPQKATVVRGFSVPEIAHARFVRTAVEVEALRKTLERWPDIDTSLLRQNIAEQGAAVVARDADRFHALDYDFHRQLCAASGVDLAFVTIAEMKAKLDRLCLLSLEQPAEMKVLLDDHRAIIDALDQNDPVALESVIRLHLNRLASLVKKIQQDHAEYFEPI